MPYLETGTSTHNNDEDEKQTTEKGHWHKGYIQIYAIENHFHIQQIGLFEISVCSPYTIMFIVVRR